MKNNKEKNMDLLLLDNQLCFALYVASKELIKKYKVLLKEYDLTYTGYIAMLALWEKDNIKVKELGERLYLDSGTLTPLLKKLEKQDYIIRERSSEDERIVYIRLSNRGLAMKEHAIKVPEELICNLNMNLSEISDLREDVQKFIETIQREK